MKNNRFKKILNINRIVFPYLIGLTYFFLFLESYTYIGFLRKFILVDSRFFLVLSIFSVSLLFYLKHSQRNYKSDVLETLVVNLNAVLFLPLVVLYFIMIAANATNYANYVFATYHIQPQNFVNLVYLSLALLVLKFNFGIRADLLNKLFGNVVEKGSFLFKQNILLLMIIFLLVFYFVDNLIKTSNRAINDLVFIATHLSYSYDDKMRKVWGFYYDYMQFVKKYTPEDATILISSTKLSLAFKW